MHMACILPVLHATSPTPTLVHLRFLCRSPPRCCTIRHIFPMLLERPSHTCYMLCSCQECCIVTAVLGMDHLLIAYYTFTYMMHTIWAWCKLQTLYLTQGPCKRSHMLCDTPVIPLSFPLHLCEPVCSPLASPSVLSPCAPSHV